MVQNLGNIAAKAQYSGMHIRMTAPEAAHFAGRYTNANLLAVMDACGKLGFDGETHLLRILVPSCSLLLHCIISPEAPANSHHHPTCTVHHLDVFLQMTCCSTRSQHGY